MTTPTTTRTGRVRDPLQRAYQSMPQKVGSHCPLCDGLLAEDHNGPFCLKESACGWRWSYPAGSTHRADGSAL